MNRRITLSLVVALAAMAMLAVGAAAVPAKYVFLFIGDGMAMPQIAAAEAYLGALASDAPTFSKLSFTQFPVAALTTTYASDDFIPDSAATATAIASGRKTGDGIIGMDPSKTIPFTSIAEMADAAGMRVGIVSSVNLDHATPACFYAHEPSRNSYYNIAMQMVDSGFDYFAGGMVRVDKTPAGQPTPHQALAANGFTVVETREGFDALGPGSLPVYACENGFIKNSLIYAIDAEEAETGDITLAEFTRKGIELLDNPNGFFMMVEGGKIDWACHANDAGASIQDTIAFDLAVQEAIAFYSLHPDETLIVVTGDHECGGMTIGFAGTGYDSAFELLAGQTVSFEWFNQFVLSPYKAATPAGTAKLADLEDEFALYFGLADFSDYERGLLENAFAQTMLGAKERATDAATYLLYGGYEPLTVSLTHILNNRAGLAWTSYSHTGIPLPTFAVGAGANMFGGYYDNTDIFHKLVQSMGLEGYASL